MLLPDGWDSVLGCKWSSAVLVALQEGDLRPSHILRRYPNLKGKVLWTQLRKLCALGLVERIAYDTYPRHTEYRLTEAGKQAALWAKTLLSSQLRTEELLTILRCRYMVAVLQLLAERPRRPKELRARLRIAEKLLFDRLAKLEAFGMVTREVLPTRPIQVRYHLTEQGRTLLPLLPPADGSSRLPVSAERAKRR